MRSNNKDNLYSSLGAHGSNRPTKVVVENAKACVMWAQTWKNEKLTWKE